MRSQSAVSHNAFFTCEEMRSNFPSFEHKDSVVCPRPRRPLVFTHDPVKPIRWQVRHQADSRDSEAGSEILDILQTKGECGVDQMPSPIASSPPFFCGSPPSRAANPLVRDARFSNSELHPIIAQPTPTVLAPPPSSTSTSRKGCATATFGLKPAAVRIEGFNCLDGGRQNRSIPAMA